MRKTFLQITITVFFLWVLGIALTLTSCEHREADSISVKSKEYFIRFDKNDESAGGTVPSPISGTYGEETVPFPDGSSLTPPPTKSFFVGWNSNSDGTGIQVNGGSRCTLEATQFSSTLCSVLVFYAQWSSSPPSSPPTGFTLTIESVTADVSFTGIKDLKGGVLSNSDKTWTRSDYPKSSTTLVALLSDTPTPKHTIWDSKYYELKWKDSGTAVTRLAMDGDKSLTVELLKKSDTWTEGVTIEVEPDVVLPTTLPEGVNPGPDKPDGSKTLTVDAPKEKIGDVLTELTPLIRPDHTHIGWETKTGTTIDITNTMIDLNATIVPKWAPTYNIVFDIDGGKHKTTESTESPAVVKGELGIDIYLPLTTYYIKDVNVSGKQMQVIGSGWAVVDPKDSTKTLKELTADASEKYIPKREHVSADGKIHMKIIYSPGWVVLTTKGEMKVYTEKQFRYFPYKYLIKEVISIPNNRLPENSKKLFKGFTKLEKIPENLDTSGVKNMSSMFAYCRKFDQNINSWDVSNVTNMGSMFLHTRSFNQDINNWDVSNVTNMKRMFMACYKFNQPLNQWNLSKVTNMYGMFAQCLNFNQNISSWDVSNVTDMSYMFYECRIFNADISNWDVLKVVAYNNFAKKSALNKNAIPMSFSWSIATKRSDTLSK